ncbi:MAG: hypothetical protein ACE37H_08005 [Phycisphaeraceae bacterium]
MQHGPKDHSDRFGFGKETADILDQLGGEPRVPGPALPASNGRSHGRSKQDVSPEAATTAGSARTDTVTHPVEEEGATPGWLDPFLKGELEVEEVAERLADEIRRDPRLMHTAWWQLFLNRLVAVLPDRLLDMAERLSDIRHRLVRENSRR